MNESFIAGPANWAAAGPGMTKMPDPMIAPIPMPRSCQRPRTGSSFGAPVLSAISANLHSSPPSLAHRKRPGPALIQDMAGFKARKVVVPDQIGRGAGRNEGCAGRSRGGNGFEPAVTPAAGEENGVVANPGDD